MLLATLGWASRSLAAPDGYAVAHNVAVTRVRVEYLCGPTPTPGKPPPNCPPYAEVEVVFRGDDCTAGDFEIGVRQKKRSQVLIVYKKIDTDCVVPGFSWGGEFMRISLPTGQIEPWKPVRFKNEVPIFWEPRP